MDLSSWALFVVTFSSILILPGPNAAFAVAQAIKHGVLKSLAVPLGFMCATGLHGSLVFLGLGVLVQEHGFILAFLKWLGVAYLLYLAYKAYTCVPEKSQLPPPLPSKLKMFFSALLVSLTNPKAILASLMIYPLFISPQGSFALQAWGLLITAMVVSFSIYSAYAAAGARFKNGFTNLRNWLRQA